MPPQTIKQIGVHYGAITGLVLAAFTMMLMIIGPVIGNPFGFVSYILLIGGIYLGHKFFKEQNEFMTYGQGLGLGVIISAITGLISGLGSFLYIKLIDNSIIGLLKDEIVLGMEEDGTPDDVIDTLMPYFEVVISPLGILFANLLDALIMGFIFSLLISVFTKKENPELFV